MRRLFFVLAFVLMAFSAWSQGVVVGHVLEQDGVVPIEGAEVTFSGFSLQGDTLLLSFFSDTLGHYEAQLVEGSYMVSARAEGYLPVFLADTLLITEGMATDTIDFVLHEICYPVQYVAARPFSGDMVRVSWSMNEPVLHENFETGDFSRFHWENGISDFPWAIDETHAVEGGFCMKSTCEGVADGHSEIEVSVFVPWSGQMSFQSKISSENPWDAGFFYIDNVQMLESSGITEWETHVFDITEGEHVFRWAYHKDALTDEGDDCFYVDDIYFYVTDSMRVSRSFQYFDLMRSRFDEPPVLLASHLTDTVFMDLQWASLDWGKYRWGVNCHYEGNRAVSDTVWSAFLDKAMTTTFEADITTNVGLSAEGAVLTLVSENNPALEYQSVANASGHVALPNVYRDSYSLRVQLDGFVDYVSDSALSVMEPTHVEVELREAVKGIDSLYVSSTGWAIWALSDTLCRDLQYFEVQLDSVFVASTTMQFFQFDVSGLRPGDTCTAQVRPVYLSDTCDWRTYRWVYRSCADFAGPTGLSWALHNESLQVSWVYPEGDFLGTMLFRDGEFLGFTEENSFFDETVSMHGEVEYCLRLIYDGPLDGTYYAMSCEQCVVAIFPAYCDPPAKLDGTTYYENESDHGALVSWGERPDPIVQWLQYDNGEYKRSIGGDGEPRIFWAIRFAADDLAEYVGSALKKVKLYDVGVGTYQLWIYVGGDAAPRTLVRSQNMTLVNAQAWHEETLSSAFEIPENEPIWIVVGQQGLARPAAACQDMGNPDGRWVSLDGETWTDMQTFNMHYTWMLRAFVTNQSGREMALGKEGYILQQYNLYRSFDNADYQQIASIPAVEGQLYYECRDNLAEDVHDDVYYRLTAFYLADNGETCESDYATTLNDPEQNYVAIDLTSTNENPMLDMKLYPNPTSGQITVALEGMQKVVVYNALGQALLNKEANDDVLQLNLSGFEDGLYWVKIISQNRIAVKPLVISK